MELNYFVFYFIKRYFCCSNYNVRHHDDLRKSVFFTTLKSFNKHLSVKKKQTHKFLVKIFSDCLECFSEHLFTQKG